MVDEDSSVRRDSVAVLCCASADCDCLSVCLSEIACVKYTLLSTTSSHLLPSHLSADRARVSL